MLTSGKRTDELRQWKHTTKEYYRHKKLSNMSQLYANYSHSYLTALFIRRPSQIPKTIPAVLNNPAGERAGNAKSNCESLPPKAKDAPSPIKVPAKICEQLWLKENLMNSNFLSSMLPKTYLAVIPKIINTFLYLANLSRQKNSVS